jgi:sec-independent protein translocase protein TatA
MLNNLTGWHALIVLAIILLVFGASKLPALAKSVGQSVRILKDEVHDGSDGGKAPLSIATAPTANPVAVAVTDRSDRNAGRSAS